MGRKKKSLEEFLTEARALHGDAYDYTCTDYRRSVDKIQIRCRRCDDVFSCWPGGHLTGSGCPKCWVFKREGLRKKKTTGDFIEAARKVHGDKFDYSLTLYTSSQKKVSIFCRDCDHAFDQVANSHLRGVGCPRCSAHESGRKRASGSAATFEYRARKVHGAAFNYSRVNFIASSRPVEIGCQACDIFFFQSPDAHLAGKGCTVCSTARRAKKRTYTTKEWKALAEATSIVTASGDFDYSKVNYVGSDVAITIGCRKCNRWFDRDPSSHLQGHSCPHCVKHRPISHMETAWLDSLNVPKRQHKATLPSGKKTKVDGFNPATNTVYAFLGSFWHADPRIMPPDQRHPIAKKLNRDLYTATLKELEDLRTAGYNVVFVWELDWKLTLQSETPGSRT